ncbi:MAG: PAS domain S-box protein [Desulfomonile sp.]|nr:PAS domain S-box protein [Desulfomonile sp.]
MKDTENQPEPVLRRLLDRCKGLLTISKELSSTLPIVEKLNTVIGHIRASLGLKEGAFVWIEVDDHTCGKPPDFDRTESLSAEIQAEGQARGRLCVCYPDNVAPDPHDEEFLREVAELVGCRVEQADREESLRQSQDRFKKLAGNLAKEMWTRTEALAKETSYLEGILRSSDDMVITTDLEGHIVEFNPAAERLLGYRAEEMQGQHINVLWENAEERKNILARITAEEGVLNYETRLMTKSGEPIEISLTLSLLTDDEGRTLGTVGVSKDITREKAIRRELEHLNRNYRETIHFISHESKNSLIVIAGFVRRLLETETDPQRREQLGIVYHHSKFLEAMSRDFLVMAELEHGEFRARKQPINNFYEEVILPAMVGLKERYPDSFETYDTSMGGVGPIQVMGDPSLLEIVYRNLFGNALKYRSPGGKISYGVEDRPDCHVFNVWNEGPGVQPEQREKIFEKFYRAEDEDIRSKRGTGLGLYNIRQIIHAHGGKIWCESVPGQWVNFLFTLPKE